MTSHFKKPQVRARFFVSVISLAVLLPALVLNTGCRGKSGTAIQNDEGEPQAKVPMVSALRVNDAGAPAQLIKGFYGVEAGMWRWTGGSFSVALKTPAGAAQKGGTLTLGLSVSAPVLAQVHTQTLTASIGGNTLKSEKYTDAGGHTFTADVPAASLTGDKVIVDFALDNSLPSSAADQRELGVIATAVGIESK